MRSAQQSGTPPGGAALANALAIGELISGLHRVYEEHASFDGRKVSFGDLMVPTEVISNIAFTLAQASLYDPQNLDVSRTLPYCST
ncbi:MAG: hypothetical protein IPK92_22925 [Nitrospira sp.]|nr:hypothetical protein [Nitrospira sp.]